MIVSRDSALAKGSPNFIFASGIGRFVELAGIPAAFGISFGLMAFTTFVYDTLDVCTRLARYIMQELLGWKTLAGKVFAAAVSIGLPLFLVTLRLTDANGADLPAWRVFWNIFGASNQLLAALALFGISVWLFKTAERKWAWTVTFFPGIWMFVMSNWALLLLVRDSWKSKGALAGVDPVPFVSITLLLLSATLAAEVIHAMLKSAGWRARIPPVQGGA